LKHSSTKHTHRNQSNLQHCKRSTQHINTHQRPIKHNIMNNSWGYAGFGGYSDHYNAGGFGGYDGYEELDNGGYDGFNDYYGYGGFGNYDMYAGQYGGGGYDEGGYGGSGGYGNRLTKDNIRSVNKMGYAEWDRVNERWDGGMEEWRFY
ncbi:hypothetical protein CC86DRAFT_425670, partial [Ophiobolus disseminans]